MKSRVVGRRRSRVRSRALVRACVVARHIPPRALCAARRGDLGAVTRRDNLPPLRARFSSTARDDATRDDATRARPRYHATEQAEKAYIALAISYDRFLKVRWNVTVMYSNVIQGSSGDARLMSHLRLARGAPFCAAPPPTRPAAASERFRERSSSAGASARCLSQSSHHHITRPVRRPHRSRCRPPGKKAVLLLTVTSECLRHPILMRHVISICRPRCSTPRTSRSSLRTPCRSTCASSTPRRYRRCSTRRAPIASRRSRASRSGGGGARIARRRNDWGKEEATRASVDHDSPCHPPRPSFPTARARHRGVCIGARDREARPPCDSYS